MDYKYKFSVVMAVYNIELYLREAIESVIAQNIGFKNIQLILVDDGTPDNSGKICDEYAEKYPNITVIHKENGGVSSARNMGIEVAEGKYINFMDPDDMLPFDAFQKIWKFFEKHQDETDAVAIRMKFFDGRRGGHILNYKFKGKSRVVDLNKEWNYIQLSMSSAFVKKEALGDLRFDSRLSHCEDAKVMQRILLEKQTLGVVTNTEYMYRRRTDGVKSAVQSSASNFGYYLPTIKYYSYETLEYAIKRCGNLPKFIQYILMYDLQWRFRMPEIPEGVLTAEETEEYLSLIIGLLKYFDDEIIMTQRHIYRDHKYYILSLKYNGELQKEVTKNDIVYSFSDTAKFKISSFRVNFEMLDVVDNVLIVEGKVSIVKFPYESCELCYSVNGELKKCDLIDRNIKSVALGALISEAIGFKVQIPLGDAEKTDVAFFAVTDGVNVPLRRSVLRTFIPITAKYKNAYCKKENWILSINKSKIIACKATSKRKFAREIKFLFEMLLSRVRKSRKVVLNRIAIRLVKLFKKRPVWLISDRASVAGDNGEAFFRYMVENHKEIDARFVIMRNSADYKNLCKIGPVIKRNSYKHKLYAAISSYIISSHAENEIYNPNLSEVQGIKDIWSNTKFVFLQHGITQNDVSGWLGKYSKNFSGFVTAAKPEYNSIIEGNYNYDDGQAWLTGFPRFDRLYDDSQKIITLMPTWRKYLSGKWDVETDLWTLIPDFKESDYFKFYNGLINNSRLINTAEKYGYKINFFPHPTLQPHMDIFDKNDKVDFLAKGTEYRDIYAKSSLILTDYSSAVFDFAYLRKPLIYTQFDKEEFFAGAHIAAQGYFDYERDGFGEVEYDLDSTVDRIIEYMENGCELKDKYRERIDNFFAFNDKNNCQRVYDKIIALSKK